MTATDRARELAIAAAQAASDKVADDIVAYDVSDVFVITDAFVLASANSDRQVRAIVDGIEERLLEIGAKPARREGEQEGRWVLLDYIDIVVHVQHAEERTYYSLERLWKDCPLIELPDSVTNGRSERPAGSVATVGPAAEAEDVADDEFADDADDADDAEVAEDDRPAAGLGA
ncbi:ribosome silencing factor [Catenulispora rubra]|uniref:ribosome silencing factor n=1 Tax=Catenulispora rubra TaxID=280293 RepID=UPI0018922D6A|nr:ribosome silencing factor [Catenulispora rubra]